MTPYLFGQSARVSAFLAYPNRKRWSPPGRGSGHQSDSGGNLAIPPLSSRHRTLDSHRNLPADDMDSGRLAGNQNDGHGHNSGSLFVRPQSVCTCRLSPLKHAQICFQHFSTAWNTHFRRRFAERSALHYPDIDQRLSCMVHLHSG